MTDLIFVNILEFKISSLATIKWVIFAYNEVKNARNFHIEIFNDLHVWTARSSAHCRGFGQSRLDTTFSWTLPDSHRPIRSDEKAKFHDDLYFFNLNYLEEDTLFEKLTLEGDVCELGVVPEMANFVEVAQEKGAEIFEQGDLIGLIIDFDPYLRTICPLAIRKNQSWIECRSNRVFSTVVTC